MVTIGSYDAEDIQDRKGTKGKLPAERDSSVSCWSFPVVEKPDEDSEKKDDVKTRIARLEKEAYEKGFEQGQRDGLALEKSKMDEMTKQLEALFAGLRDLKPQIYSESEEEILKLVLLIARKVVREEISINRKVIGNTIKAALSYLTEKRKIKIIISPDDMEEVKTLLPDLSRLTKGGYFQLMEDNAMEKGGCTLETGFGRINGTIEDQLGMIEEEIKNHFQSAKEAPGASQS